MKHHRLHELTPGLPFYLDIQVLFYQDSEAQVWKTPAGKQPLCSKGAT